MMGVSTDTVDIDLANREQDVAHALAQVRDPEIDAPIGELRFITDTKISGDKVTVFFRLPTFWCPANFAFMMADDMRNAVMGLPWVKYFELRLDDHFAAAEINEGISKGRSFDTIFPREAGKDIAETRRTFDEKSFLSRQGELIKSLRQTDMSQDKIFSLKLSEVDHLISASDDVFREQVEVYVEKRICLGLSSTPEDALIVDIEGAPVAASEQEQHLIHIRRTKTAARAAGAMCKILLTARFDGVGCTKPYNKNQMSASAPVDH